MNSEENVVVVQGDQIHIRIIQDFFRISFARFHQEKEMKKNEIKKIDKKIIILFKNII